MNKQNKPVHKYAVQTNYHTTAHKNQPRHSNASITVVALDKRYFTTADQVEA